MAILKKLYLLLIAISLALSACTSVDTPYVSDTKWEPIYVSGTDKKPVALSEGDKVFVSFQNQNRINGMSGDNLFHGTFMIEDGGRVYVGSMASTRRAGPNMQYEAAFLDAISKTAIVEMRKEQLYLMSSKGDVLMKLKRID